MSALGLIVNGIVVVLLGLILSKYVQPNVSGDWPTVLSYGAHIMGIGSIMMGLSQMSGGKDEGEKGS